MTKLLDGKIVVITGGTGSLGQTLVKTLLSPSERLGSPTQVVVFSRDEEKQDRMRKDVATRAGTDLVDSAGARLLFRLGDIRDYSSVSGVLQEADIVINAAALKQVPSCEFAPCEAVKTNILGAENIVRAIQREALPVQLVIGISTDKACKPVNVMGMTKAIQERIFVQANAICRGTRFSCVRYGNVVGSRGSVIPLFRQQIARGGPVTVTSPEMTRFLVTLPAAIDAIEAAIRTSERGSIMILKARSARITDIARAMVGDRSVPIEFTGVRPGEKTHEVLVSEEEATRVRDHGKFLEVMPVADVSCPGRSADEVDFVEYSSRDRIMSPVQVEQLLAAEGYVEHQAKTTPCVG